MATKHDDLDAIRVIIDTVSPFDPQDQKRIIRWVCEKLGITLEGGTLTTMRPIATSTVQPTDTPILAQPSITPTGPQVDIKSFLKAKNPTSDMQFAATVAYFYAFEALEAERKEAISSDELQEACRLLGRERLHNPGQTLRNAVYNGLLDKAGEKGHFKINTVGENLVAVTLPAGDSTPKAKPSRKRVKKKVSSKKTKKETNRKSGENK